MSILLGSQWAEPPPGPSCELSLTSLQQLHLFVQLVGLGSVDNANAVAYLPIWTFVDEGDFLYNSVVNNDKIYGPYLNDSL